MSTNNIEFIQNNVYANFETGNIPALMEVLDENISWVHHGSRELIPFAGEWQGVEGAGQMLQTFAETVEPVFMNVKDIVASGDKVVVQINESYKVKATGKAYVTEVVHIWTVQEGKVTRFDELYDSAAIAEAFAA